MTLTFRVPPPFDQSEVLGDLPDRDITAYAASEEQIGDDVIEETTTTRRVLRTHSVPDNAHDPDATIRSSLMAQRRGNSVAARGEEWTDIDAVPLSSLHAGYKVKLDLGPNQTKRLFLHLGRRYKEVNKLPEILRCIEVEVLDADDIDATTIDAVKRMISEIADADQAQVLIQLLNEAQGNSEVLRQLVELAKN